ncbi:MAG TPA: cupin domain-containing protein [Anaerolineae bacterium]|nr:cupin domain-containing protein [Anaerolineae bacterium]
MDKQPKIVFKVKDVPYIESLDGTMRDSVMVTEDTCGSQQYTAGLFWVRPGTRGHADRHPGQEEVYYIFGGKGQVVIEDVPHDIEAGDVVFIPDGHIHYLINDGPETLGLFWAIAKKWSELPAIQKELGRWNKVKPGSDWGPLPTEPI